jgi:hypothetical protein
LQHEPGVSIAGLPTTKNFMADIPEEEPLFSKLTEEEQVAYNELRLLTTTYVSDAVRRECEAEMEAAKKRGWKYR